jgi:hypothetical protein
VIAVKQSLYVACDTVGDVSHTASNVNEKPGSPTLVSLPQFVSSSVTVTVVLTDDVRKHTNVLYVDVGAKSTSMF